MLFLEQAASDLHTTGTTLVTPALTLSRLLGQICPADFLKLSIGTHASRNCLV